MASTVATATPDGWLIRIKPGDHPFAHQITERLIAYDDPDVRVSGDENFHVCLGKKSNVVFCIYVPPMGM